MNTNQNDVRRTDGPPCGKYFQMSVHTFNAHPTFIITEEVFNKSLSKLKFRSLLKQRENFCILKLQTLCPQGLNISLNYVNKKITYPQDTTGSI